MVSNSKPEKKAIKGRKQLIHKWNPEAWFAHDVLKKNQTTNIVWFRKTHGVTWRQTSARYILLGSWILLIDSTPQKYSKREIQHKALHIPHFPPNSSCWSTIKYRHFIPAPGLCQTRVTTHLQEETVFYTWMRCSTWLTGQPVKHPGL